MRSPPHVTIVLLNWNNWEDTLECLESVFRSDYPTFRVVVCDNASSDGSAERIRGWAEGRVDAPGPPLGHALRAPTATPAIKPIAWTEHDRQTAEAGGIQGDAQARLILVHTGANLGFAGGNNVGLRYFMARHDSHYVWILNNDTVVDSAALGEMVTLASADSLDRPVGSNVYDYDEPDKLQLCGGQRIGIGGLVAPRYTARLAEVDYLMGASIFLSRQRLLLLGFINEDYFLNAEDLEFTYFYKRDFARLYPRELPFLVGGRIWHKESATQGRDVYRHSYYFTRNVLYIASKIGTWSSVLTLGYALVRIALALVRGRGRHARGVYAGILDFMKGIKGPYPHQ